MKRRKGFIFAVIILAALVFPFIRAPAAHADGNAGRLIYKAEVNGIPIDGADITLYKIAGIETSGDGSEYFDVSEPYLSILEGVSESEMQENARLYAEKLAAEAAEPYATVTTDANGRGEFSVERGVYLVKETAKSGTAAQYSDFEPSVIRIPEINDDGTENMNVSAELKIPPYTRITPTTVPPSPTTTVTPAPSSGPSKVDASSPKTGDETHIEFYIVVLALAAGVFLTAWKFRRR